MKEPLHLPVDFFANLQPNEQIRFNWTFIPNPRSKKGCGRYQGILFRCSNRASCTLHFAQVTHRTSKAYVGRPLRQLLLAWNQGLYTNGLHLEAMCSMGSKIPLDGDYAYQVFLRSETWLNDPEDRYARWDEDTSTVIFIVHQNS